MTKNYFLLAAIVIIDIIILPQACHYKYVFNDKFLDVKGIVIPGAVVPLSSILAVEKYSLMLFPGFGGKLLDSSLAALRITYKVGKIGDGRRASILINPKDKQAFIHELGLRIDKNLILINNTESAFKKKKDDI